MTPTDAERLAWEIERVCTAAAETDPSLFSSTDLTWLRIGRDKLTEAIENIKRRMAA